jgi:hypothetical protein
MKKIKKGKEKEKEKEGACPFCLACWRGGGMGGAKYDAGP